MSAAKSKAKQRKPRRRHKYCPKCREVVAMSVIREAECEDDLYWLQCPSCDSKYALTRGQFIRGKRPSISAVKEVDARIYRTSQTYSVGEIIYHRKLEDIGLVLDKASAPIDSCSGAIVVSFAEIGQKTLIEGYTAA